MLGEGNHSRINIWVRRLTEKDPSLYKLIAVIQNWEKAELWVKCGVSTDFFMLRAASMEKWRLRTQNFCLICV